jgi:predicted dehydrogenase
VADELRVGLIGYGAVAQIHVQAYRALRNVALVAVADTDESKLARVRAETGAVAYSSVGRMLRNESLDIACVLTPPTSHERLTIECAAAGVHVLCEKPMALTVEACENMIAACRMHGVRLCYGASYRYLPALAKARDMVLSGALGQVLLLREQAVGGKGVEHRQTLGASHYTRGGPGGSGMGLVDHGIHLIDAFGWMLNSPVKRVCGRGNISGAPQGPEFAVLEYENGALGFLLYEDGTFASDLPSEGIFSWGSGWDVDGPVDAGAWSAYPGCIHVHGTKGALRIFHYANALFHRGPQGIRQISVENSPAPLNFAAQLMAFANAIRAGHDVPVPGEVGREACRTLLQIYSSPF